jgi:regulator of replication initiation timing
VAHNIRIVQDRARKETKEVKNKELQELRKENQKLRRENSRLRRDLAKRLNYEPEEATAEEFNIPAATKELCPECGSDNIGKMNLGSKEITVCKACKWRKISA